MFGSIKSGVTLLVLFKGNENIQVQETQPDNKNTINDLVPVDEIVFIEGDIVEEPFEKKIRESEKMKKGGTLYLNSLLL